MAKQKTPFFETKFGKFVKKAGKVVPDVLDVAADVISGDISGAVQKVRDKIDGAALRDERAMELQKELQLAAYDFEKEMERYAVEDRKNSREREMEYVRHGRFDWEHFIMAMCGLGAFAFIIHTLVFRNLIPENRDLFIHLMGIIEGVVISMYSYHFGTTKSSRAKDTTIANVLKSKD